MLAGVMMAFQWPQLIPLQLYVPTAGKYVRHPDEYIYTFSRDQTICLFAGLRAQGLQGLVDAKYATEGDIVMPSVRGHFKRCAGLQANALENMWLWLDVAWSVYIKPNEETNQLLCMLLIADEKYMQYYLKKKPTWRQNIINYWCNWRNEFALAQHMIDFIETKYGAPLS